MTPTTLMTDPGTEYRPGDMRLPYYHSGQQQVYDSRRRFNWLSAGRRWRKTTMCMRLAATEASAGAEILWGAPTYDQCRIGWDELRRAARGAEWIEFNEGRMECKFTPSRSGIIRFRSLDNPDNARGHTADGVVIDEAAEVSPTAWTEVILPMLMSTKGWAWIIGTPAGRNWFWREWRRASLGEVGDSIAWQAPSLGVEIVEGKLIRKPHPLENPEIEYGEIASLFASMPERAFRQEILAEFVEDGGGVFRNVRAVSVLEPDIPPARDEEPFIIIGVDWGRHNDFTVFSVLDASQKPVKQVAMERSNQVSWAVQEGRLQALCDKWKPVQVIAENNSMGEPLIERMQSNGYPVTAFTTTNASKQQAIDALSLAFEHERVLLLADENQISELESYEMERLPGGSYRYGAPVGMHDDTVIALALAWQGAKSDYGWFEEKEEEKLTDQEEFVKMVREYGPQMPERAATGWGRVKQTVVRRGRR